MFKSPSFPCMFFAFLTATNITGSNLMWDVTYMNFSTQPAEKVTFMLFNTF